MFYYLLFESKLISRFISVSWGLIAVLLMLITLLPAIFGQGTHMILFLPLDLNHLFLGIWLLIKGITVDDKTY